jgi:2-polyprenyl-3-methyl-5-hydroxy-6-metoxy-1,4-benzoquinol methylase
MVCIGARRFDEAGVPEVTTLASSIARDARVLDIGCGNGVSLTKVLSRAGHRTVGT